VKLRVLVVDDDPSLSQALKRTLGRRHHHVVTSHSVQDALKALDREDFDCVLTDYILDDGHGTEVLARCRVRLPRARRLLLTALVPTLPEAVGRDMLAEHVLPKPCALAQLLSAIEGREP
jgi:DNA-binding response OmpR family regulator